MEQTDAYTIMSSPGALPTDALSLLVAEDAYSAWLLDQFGVLHDGVDPYEHAIDLVRKLKEEKQARLVILTNSARSAPHTYKRLEGMGFKREWFCGVATSGDVCTRVLSLTPGQHDDKLLPREHPLWKDISGRNISEEGKRKRRCLHFTWSKFDKVTGIDLDALDIEVTTDPEQADFVLVHWMDCIALEGNQELRKVSEEDIEDLLAQCAKFSLPMLVANPDIVACKGEALLPMPGSLAVKYKELGVPIEKIHLLGKPSPIMYNYAKDSFLSDVPKSEIIAVGDSLEHDIKGACTWEVDSAFITRGIHCNDLHECEIPEDMWVNKDELEKLCLEHNADPTICSEFFGL